MTSTDTTRLVMKSIDATGSASFIVMPSQVHRLSAIAEYLSSERFELTTWRGLFINNDMIEAQLTINQASLPDYTPMIKWMKIDNKITINRDELIRWIAISQIWISDAMKWVVDVICMSDHIILSSIDVWSENDIVMSWSSQKEVSLKLTNQYLSELCSMCKDDELVIEISDKLILKYSKPWLTVLFWSRTK